MKFMTALLFSTFILSAQAENFECLASRTGDLEFIAAALNLEEVQDADQITQLSWDRWSATKGYVRIVLNGEKRFIFVEQDCQTTRVIAKMTSLIEK